MLLWLQNWLQQINLPKSHTVLSKLFIFCTSFHLIFLFIVFFMYKGDTTSLTFFANRNFNANVPIIFMPLFKHVQPQVLKSSIANAPNSETETIKKSQQSNVVETKADKATQLVPVGVKKKTKAKKEKRKNKAKNDKVAELKAKKIEEKIEKKAEEKKQEEVSPTKIEENSTNDAQYIGRSDLDALQMQEFINQEMAQNWKPPFGIPKDKACDIKIVVDWQGALKNVSIAKSSSVLIYDNAARDAVTTMKFPKWLWGKEFTITFKQ